MPSNEDLLQLAKTAYTHPLYKHVQDQVANDWSLIPTISRAELQRTVLRDRLFVSFRDVEILRPTSGTSGKGILIVPRALSEFDLTTPLQQEVYKELNITRLASFSAGQPHFSDSYIEKLNVQTIALDPGDLSTAEHLVDQFKPDMLAGPTYVLERFAELLSEANREAIKAVQVFGERTSASTWQALQDAFPKGQVFTEYAMIETQASVGAPCTYIRERGEQYFHMIPNTSYLELVDVETGEAVTSVDQPGEIVVTTIRPSATTLIRYRTGDQGRIIRNDCPCGNGPVFTAEGRLTIDRIRIPNGELNVAELDRVIATLKSQLKSNNYVARYSETVDKPQLTITLDAENPALFSEQIARELRIAPKHTYHNAVTQGLLLPLQTEVFVPPQTPGKHKRLIKVDV